jgi:hypothetical protein
MIKYTQTTLDKIERILDEAEYIVRYERGTFQSGYCILEQRKVVVLNKFLQMDPENLAPETRRFYDDVVSAHQVSEG